MMRSRLTGGSAIGLSATDAWVSTIGDLLILAQWVASLCGEAYRSGSFFLPRRTFCKFSGLSLEGCNFRTLSPGGCVSCGRPSEKRLCMSTVQNHNGRGGEDHTARR